MVINPPVSSKKERKQERQLNSYQFWGKTNAETRPLNGVFPRPERRVSGSWSCPPEVLQKSCKKWLVWTKGFLAIIWKLLQKAIVKYHILSCYLTSLNEAYVRVGICFSFCGDAQFKYEGLSPKDTFLEQDRNINGRMVWRSLSHLITEFQ